MLTIRAMSNGAGYSARHLQHSDYYAEGERVTGQWQGRGAEMLGLAGEVQSEQFEALRQGVDPQTGEFLRQRHSADRTAADGSTQSRGRNLYDFTISAPKSVSIMAQPGGDVRLVEAHGKAVQETLKELEHRAASRVRRDRANDNRITGNLVLAVYHHDTSRELDPQLHTHAVAANLTYDGAEGRWKALQASDIYEQRAYLTEVYRNTLAREVRSLGYEIEDRRNSKGKNLGFEIKGVSDELLEKYSQRSEQRDRAIGEFVESKGHQPSDNEIAVLVRESRADKLVEISTAEVHSRQTARLTPEESLTLGQIREAVRERSETQRLEPESAVPSLDYAKQHVFERVSVALDHELLTEALRHGRGRVDLADLKGEFSLEESNGRILQAGKEVATRESLDRERDMIERINRGIGQFERLCVSLHGDYRYDALKNTTEELRSQDATLLRALSETACDMNLVVIGYSGRDASVMSVLREAYSRQGTGRLYWCGFEDDTPPPHVDELLRTARQAGCREAHYVSSLGFDDLIVRLARHCLPDHLTQQARERIDSNSGQGRTAFVPFALESAPVTSVIKSNAFPVECPSEVYQFDASGFDEKGAWARLREHIEGKPIVAALQRGKIIAMGALDEIRSAFADCLKGEIVRVPVTEKDLSIADGIITRLYTDAITRGLAASKNLKVHGHNVLWEGRPFTDTTVYSVRLHVHAAATIGLRRYAGRQYLVIKPSIHGTTQSGAAVDDESDKELKRQILSRQWNKKFNDALNEWRTRLLGKGPTTIEFLPNTASPFKFTVRSTPVFAKIGEHRKPPITLSPVVERAVTQTGVRLAEPQLRFSRKTGPGFVSDTQPIRGMVNNRPFDFTLTGNKFNPEVRVGIICPSRDSMKLSQYLAAIHSTKTPDSKDEYLLTYPGFAQAFGLPLNLPKPGDGGWVDISEPSSGASPSSGATELARNINAAVRSLRASWNPDVVVVYIPTRWKIWEL